MCGMGNGVVCGNVQYGGLSVEDLNYLLVPIFRVSQIQGFQYKQKIFKKPFNMFFRKRSKLISIKKTYFAVKTCRINLEIFGLKRLLYNSFNDTKKGFLKTILFQMSETETRQVRIRVVKSTILRPSLT